MWSTKATRTSHDLGHVDDRGYAAGAVAGFTAEERRRAVRAVASMAVDAVDCARLLDALGLDPSESGVSP